jgi:uncharacterized membrane protein YjjP (DUF1212 family)
MGYDEWKQKAPPSDIDFEEMTEEEQLEQEIYEQRLKIELAKKQINHIKDIVKDSQPYIYELLNKIQL